MGNKNESFKSQEGASKAEVLNGEKFDTSALAANDAVEIALQKADEGQIKEMLREGNAEQNILNAAEKLRNNPEDYARFIAEVQKLGRGYKAVQDVLDRIATSEKSNYDQISKMVQNNDIGTLVDQVGTVNAAINNPSTESEKVISLKAAVTRTLDNLRIIAKTASGDMRTNAQTALNRIKAEHGLE